MRRHIRRALGGLAAAAVLASSSPAAAQDGILDDETTRLISTLAVITSASTTVYFLQALSDRLLDEVFADAQRYMNNNSVALQQDISVGAGEALADLATIYAIPDAERGAFYARVRTHREELLAILDTPRVELADVVRFTYLALTEAQLTRLQPAEGS